MSRPLLPPRGLFVSTAVLFDRRIPSAVLPTLLQLMALAWGSREHATPPLPMQALCGITRRPPRTLYGHLAVLRDQLAALRMLPAGDGLVSLVFAEWLYPATFSAAPPGAKTGQPGMPAEDPFCQLLQMPDEEDQDSSPPLPVHSPLPDPRTRRAGNSTGLPPRHSPQNRPSLPGAPSPPTLPATVQAAVPASVPTALPAELESALLEAGVFPALLPEVAASGLPPLHLQALLAWSRADDPQQPARLFMARLRAGGRPPKVYLQPACPRCGRHGGHDPGCPQRYLDGPYGEYVER